MKKVLGILLICLLVAFVLPAEKLVLRLVANVPVQTYCTHDTFILDKDDKKVSVEVFGATEIEKDLYKVTDSNVTLKLTRL